MASNETKRINAETLQEDIEAYNALKGITGYASVNAEFELTAITAKKASMETAQEQETIQEGIAKGKRDAATSAEWNFHNLILGAKGQVKAKYGEDSDEWQSLGMKKKSERKKPARRPAGSTPPPAP